MENNLKRESSQSTDPNKVIKTEEIPKKEEIPRTYINTTNNEKRVWLVKIPKFVSDAWSAIADDGVEIGTVRIYNSSKTDSRVTLHMSDALVASGVPRNYSLGFTNTSPEGMHVFTEDPNSGMAISIAGKIHHEVKENQFILIKGKRDAYYR